jgi:hypothetical protein
MKSDGKVGREQGEEMEVIEVDGIGGEGKRKKGRGKEK